MPYFSFKEIWTPLTLFGIRLFREVHDRSYWIKIGNKPRRPIFH